MRRRGSLEVAALDASSHRWRGSNAIAIAHVRCLRLVLHLSLACLPGTNRREIQVGGRRCTGRARGVEELMEIASDFARWSSRLPHVSGTAADEAPSSRSRRNRLCQSVRRVEETDPPAVRRFAWPQCACQGSSHARATRMLASWGRGSVPADGERRAQCARSPA